MNYDLAMIHRGSINQGWVESVLDTQARYPWNRLWMGDGKKLEFDKNDFTLRWLAKGETDWLLWTDEGLRFTADDVRAVTTFSDEPAVVAGLWWHARPDGGSYAGVFTEERDGKLLVDYDWVPPKHPIKVLGTGGGFMAIHRIVAADIINDIPHDADYPFFRTRTLPNGAVLGYSEFFARQVATTGYPYYLLPDVKIIHYETIGMTP